MANRWESLIRRLKGEPHPEHTELILQSYQESHRHFHCLSVHVRQLLEELDTLSSYFPEILELFIWLHDLFYDPKRQDNELASAILAEEIITESNIENASHMAETIAEMIKWSQHHNPSNDLYVQCAMDLDLSILGKPLETVALWHDQIRAEYSHLAPDEFIAKRIEFLRQFSQRDPIFQTKHFRTKYEEQAKKNLTVLLTPPFY